MKAAIFDMDGTLIDSMSVWYTVTERLLKNYNISMKHDFAKKVQEMTLDESCLYMTKNFNLGISPEELLIKISEIVAHEYKNNLQLKPFAKDYLHNLHANGIKLAVATSGFFDLCKIALSRLGIYELFDIIVTSSEVGVNKSNPDIYLLAADKLGVNPADCVVYEDILSAVYGAKKAGMTVVGVYDITSEYLKEEIKSAADSYIMSWAELL